MCRLKVGLCSQLTEHVFSQLKAIGIYSTDTMLVHDIEDLAKRTKIPFRDLMCIKYAILSEETTRRNNEELLHEILTVMAILDTGSENLNMALHGGIYTGEVTEIHGFPGSGKTQFCLSIVSTLLLEAKGTALYLDTNSNFAPSRLEEMLKAKSKKKKILISTYLDRVRVLKIQDIYNFYECINYIKSEIDEKKNIFLKHLRLFIIDSIAPLLSSCSSGKYLDSIGMRDEVLNQLKYLSSQLTFAILICNNTIQRENCWLFKPHETNCWPDMIANSLFISKINSTTHKISASKSCRTGLFDKIMFNITEGGITE